MERAKNVGVFFLLLLVGYLLIRVYSVSAERDHARDLAGAYKLSAESSGQTLAKLAALEGKTDALLALREKEHAQIMQNRENIRAAVKEAALSSPDFAAWRQVALPPQYRPGPDGLLGKTASYYSAGLYSGQAAGGADAALAGAGVAGPD